MNIPEPTIEAVAKVIEDMESRFPEKTIAKVALQAALSEGGVVLTSRADAERQDLWVRLQAAANLRLQHDDLREAAQDVTVLLASDVRSGSELYERIKRLRQEVER